MPTGYTAAVQDGTITELADFAWMCARGMGALIPMRDAPMDAPIPEMFEPDTKYADKRIAECKDRIRWLLDLSAADCETQAATANNAAEKSREERVAEKSAQRQRYEAMIAKVEAWETGAEGIRDFMLEQLRQSLDFDCGNYEPPPVIHLKPHEWFLQELERATDGLRRAEQNRKDEVERTDGRNQWLAALRASLAP